MKLLGNFFTLVMLVASFSASADNFVVLATDAKVFDTPKAGSYVTTNRDGNEVVLLSGMAVKSKDLVSGWHLVEYSPGLNGYLMDAMTVAPAKISAIKAGKYSVSNNPSEHITIMSDGKKWSAVSSSNPAVMDAEMINNVLIIYNKKGDVAYSAGIVSGKPTVFTYSNDITKFF